jgi:hypothetical protein
VNFDTFGLASILIGIGLSFGVVAALAHLSARRQHLMELSDDEQLKARMGRMEFRAMGAFVGAIGLVSLAAACGLLRSAIDESHWPVVTGRVVATEIFSRMSRQSKHTRIMYWPRITFTYAIGGSAYESPIDSSVSRSSRPAVEAQCATVFPKGSAHLLRINTANQHDARLASSPIFLVPSIFGLAGLLCSAAGIFLLRR